MLAAMAEVSDVWQMKRNGETPLRNMLEA